MQEIVIGPKVRGYSTTLTFEGENMRVSLGASTTALADMRRYVATCEAFGLRFVITDEDKFAQLSSAATRQEASEVRRLLASFVPEFLASRPELFAQVMDERFKAGVQEGRRQKARELKKFFDDAGG